MRSGICSTRTYSRVLRASAFLATASALCLATADGASAQSAAQASEMRSLPAPDFRFQGQVGRTINDSDPATFPQPVQPPEGAPNVLLIMLDDVGFGQFDVFGGGVSSPGMDKLASEGLRYNRFHTTAMCSPTRASLLTGRDHHVAATGMITELATGYDGYTAMIPRSTGTISEILRQNGYATAWIGKNHNTPTWEVSEVGPFDRRPNAWGFDYFYGFNAADISQLKPVLTENRVRVIPPDDPDYHLTTDLADHAINWMQTIKQIDPGRPYFIYVAPACTHMPHQPPADWRDRFKGQFDMGWDRYREQTIERQKKLGVVPQDTELTPRPADLPAWDSLPPERQRLHARQMELFAAYGAHCDFEMARIMEAASQLPGADNTLTIYVVGDNGASAEGGIEGSHNELANNNNAPPTWQETLAVIDDLGTEKHYNHIPAGWTWAMNTPFQWMKVVASHLGGTRNPLLISWPGHITDAGGLRDQVADVTDIFPTILEAAGIQPPDSLNGITQKPISGISLAYTFDDAQAKERRHSLMFELGTNRAIYQDGWMASSLAVKPWEMNADVDVDKTVWELYHLDEDFSQAKDLAKQEPDRLRQLQDLWWAQAARNDVLPLDWRASRLSDQVSGRPRLGGDRKTFEYTTRLVGLPEGSAPDLKNKSFSIAVNVDIPAGGAQGVLYTQGGNTAGWAFLIQDHKLIGIHNFVDRERYRVESSKDIPEGKSVLTLNFDYDGGGTGKGGIMSLLVNGDTVAEGRVERTPAIKYSIFEGQDIGEDLGTPVDYSYAAPFKFTGKIEHVTVDLR